MFLLKYFKKLNCYNKWKLLGEKVSSKWNKISAVEAAEIAAKTGLRGMDALVVQVAKEYNAELISFDKEMMRKSRVVLKKR
ncbi:MAG: PIN domain-containing protein [Candidatus Brocadia sp.]|nr:PIN domain-containing protein [Candidatus Brocadia sp.]